MRSSSIRPSTVTSSMGSISRTGLFIVFLILEFRTECGIQGERISEPAEGPKSRVGSDFSIKLVTPGKNLITFLNVGYN